MKKTVYYSDELHEDFAATQGIHAEEIPEDYPYVRRSVLWRVVTFLVFRVIVTPLVFLFCKLLYGVRIRGKSHLRGLKQGYFLYANHTQHACDAFIPSLVSFPRKSYIVTAADAVSLPGLRHIVQMLGAIPLPPQTARGFANFSDALKTRVGQGSAVCIYPEAHIWPYYTRIRPFGTGSFAYPIRCGVPAVPYTVTYRERRIFKRLHPLITVYVGEPIFPDPDAPERAERRRLRDAVYRFMTETAASVKQPEYIRYVKKTPPDPTDST